MQDNSYEHLRRMSILRHEATRYNKFAVFYRRGFPALRTELNQLCAKVLRDEIEIEEFFRGVDDIESRVNLNKKHIAKQWIEKETQRLLDSWHIGKPNIYKARQMAKGNLSKILQLQSKYQGGHYK